MGNVIKPLASEIDTSRRGRIDWPLVVFFLIAYAIAWSMVPVLGRIAQLSNVADWVTLSEMAEKMDFGEVDLAVPGWLVYLITRVQDFAFTIAGLIMIFSCQGRKGLLELGRRLIRWRVNLRWYFLALLPFVLYGLATIVSGSLRSFTFSPAILGRVLFSAQAGFLVYFFFRGAMGEELGLRGFALLRLQKSHSAFRASVVIGVLWAAWHIPVLLNRDFLSIAVFFTARFCSEFHFHLAFQWQCRLAVAGNDLPCCPKFGRDF